MKNILFFSNNTNKLREIKDLLKNLLITVLSPNDLGIDFEPKEVGKSFSENAKIKSIYGYKNTSIPCFGDDSGISIEALGWKPNIFSKKFISSFNNEKECFKYIIDKVKRSGKNRAYFQTSICLTLKNKYHIVFEGRVDGTISNTPRGYNGFGYDPIFMPMGYSKTFGEFNKNEKNKLSHRSIAINKLINFLSV